MTTAVDRPVLPSPDSPVYRMADGSEFPRVSTILREAGLSNFDAQYYTEEVRDRGTRVHAAIHQALSVGWSTYYLDIEGYISAFRQWQADTDYLIDASEVPVANSNLRYAGTVDLLARRRGSEVLRYIVDIKCGTVPPTVGPQTAAYARCLPGWWFRAVLNLRSDGSYRFGLLDDPEDDVDFLAALRLYHRKRSKYAIG